MRSFPMLLVLALVLSPVIIAPLGESAAATTAFRECCILLSVTGEVAARCTSTAKILHCTPVLAAPDEIRLLP